MEHVLTVLDGAAASVRTLTSLRAACGALAAGSSRISAVSVSGCLAEDEVALPILSAAERLAAEYGYAVVMRLDGRRFQVRFARGATGAVPDAGEAG
ncbi:MAG TPA: hypothetical protein VF365_09070 [Candidatus Limnocylindria bacterium]